LLFYEEGRDGFYEQIARHSLYSYPTPKQLQFSIDTYIIFTMQKATLIFLLLCSAAAAFAQKPIVQQAGYIGIDLYNLSLGYDARFRNSGAKPDFSVGAGLNLPVTNNSYYTPLGVQIHGSMLLGKPSSSFEMGANLNLSTVKAYYRSLTPNNLVLYWGEQNFL
jgi:hypothetical protein